MSVIVKSPSDRIAEINKNLNQYFPNPVQAIPLLNERYRLEKQLQTELSDICVLCRPWAYSPPGQM